LKKLYFLLCFLILLSACQQTWEPQKSYQDLLQDVKNLLNADKIDSAQIIIDQLLDLKTDDFEVIFLKGLSQQISQDYSAAIQSYTMATELDSSSANLYFNRGFCFFELAQKDRFYSDMQKAADLDTNFEFQIQVSQAIRNSLSEEEVRSLEGFTDSISRNEAGEKHGPWSSYYPRGSLYAAGEYTNGFKTGLEKHFYESGQLHIEKSYQKGILEGPYRSYHENGQIATEAWYKKGKLGGKYQTWYASGKKQSEEFYKKGEPEGLQTFWFESAKIKIQKSYQNGLLQGESKIWSNKHNAYLIAVYDQGKLLENRIFQD